MALTQITATADKIQYQRIGYNGISLTNYDSDVCPEVSKGSVIEVDSKLFRAASNELISGWGGIPDDTNTFVVVSDIGNISYLFTPPTWDTERQGWYDGTSRYVAEVYKTNFTTYAHKRIYHNRVMGYNANIDIYDYDTEVEVLLLETLLATGSNVSDDFMVLKPIMGYLWCNDTGAAAHTLKVEIYQNSTYGEVMTWNPNFVSSINNPYGIILNPGIYRLSSTNAGGVATLQNKLFVSGIYGSDSVTKLRAVQT